jgi:hypothetical protein
VKFSRPLSLLFKGTGTPSPGLKWPARAADQSPPSSAEVNEWSNTTTPPTHPTCLHSVYGDIIFIFVFLRFSRQSQEHYLLPGCDAMSLSWYIWMFQAKILPPRECSWLWNVAKNSPDYIVSNPATQKSSNYFPTQSANMPANLAVNFYRNEMNACDTLRQNIAYFILHQVQKEVL